MTQAIAGGSLLTSRRSSAVSQSGSADWLFEEGDDVLYFVAVARRPFLSAGVRHVAGGEPDDVGEGRDVQIDFLMIKTTAFGDHPLLRPSELSLRRRHSLVFVHLPPDCKKTVTPKTTTHRTASVVLVGSLVVTSSCGVSCRSTGHLSALTCV